MTEALQQEIRTLRTVFESARDPEGRVFAPLADACRRVGEVQEAVRLLSEGLAKHPDFVPGHVVAAQLYVEQGLSEEAVIAARRALALDADNVNALRSLLVVLEDRGDGEADQVRDRLMELDPVYASETRRVSGGTVPEPPPGGGNSDVETDWDGPRAAVKPGDEATEPDVDSEADTVELLALGGQDPAASAPELAALEHEALEPEADSAAADFAEETVSELAGEEPLLDLDALGPLDLGTATATGGAGGDQEGAMDLDVQEPVVDLDSLAVVSADVEPEDLLVTPPTESEPGMDLPTEEPVIELADLAPADLEADEVSDFVDLADLSPDEPGEPVVDLGELAPTVVDADEPADVVSLADLAPDSAEEEEAMPLEALAPDVGGEAAGEEVMELADLAPDVAPEPVADLAPDEPVAALADLAPDEPVVDLADLSPDEPAEPVVDLGELAPTVVDADEPADVVSLADLAPDSAEDEEEAIPLEALAPDVGGAAADEEVMELADLAPDVEPELVADVADLAPDEPATELADLAPDEPAEPVVDLADLAPAAPDPDDSADVASRSDLAPEQEDGEAETVPLEALAPDVGGAAADEPVMELSDLAPEEDVAAEMPVADQADLAPDEADDDVSSSEGESEDVTMLDLVADADAEAEVAAPEAETPDDDDESTGEPVYTRTLAELYVKQGAIERAIEVYRHLSELSPEDDTLTERISELEAGDGVEESSGHVLDGPAEEEVETLARELAESGNGPSDDVESPFTLDGHEASGTGEDEAEEGPTIVDYFDELLGWSRGRES